MSKHKSLPPQAELHRLLEYDTSTGVFKWKGRNWLTGSSQSFNKSRAGRIAGRKRKDGYWVLCLNKVSYLGHRIAWMYHYGVDPGESGIDHINNDHADNRIANLRLASQGDNTTNRGKVIGSATEREGRKYKGVYRYGNETKWWARIIKNRKGYSLGRFDTQEEARDAYNAAGRELHGEFFKPS